MGRPIVYCDVCGKLLREEDFSRGRAHEVDHRNYCVDCRPLPAAAMEEPKKISSTRIPAPSRPHSKSAHHAVPPAPAPPPSKKGWIVGSAAAGLLVLAVVIAVASSGGRKGDVEGSGEAEFRMKPATRPKADPAPSLAADEPFREILRLALQFQRLNPDDFEGQVRELEAAIRKLGSSPYAEDARQKLAAVHQRLRHELAEVEKQAAPLASAEEFGSAINVLSAARPRYAHAAWGRGVDQQFARVRALLEAAKADVRAKAGEARAKKSPDEMGRLSARVSRWGIPEEAADLAVHLSMAAPADPPPPPPTPPPPAADPLAPKRAVALAHAGARDYEAALAALDDPALKGDAELFRAAQAAAQEGAAALLRSARGKKIAVDYRDAAGRPAKIDDLLLRSDAARIEVKFGNDSIVIPVGEVAARTLAESFRTRPHAKPEDARAAAALCFIEGDVDGAKGMEIPDRFKGPPPPPDEAARRIFYDAELAAFEPGRQAEALAAYRALLAEHGSTSFVRRNRAAIRSRLEAPKEIVFLAEELGGGGTFKLQPNRRVEKCWTSEKDLEGEPRKGNYVEFSFPAQPEKPLRAFAYVGGCCAETFTAHLQGTEMKAADGKAPAEPGGDADLPLKHTITGLKRKHGDHLGPKEPDRWEWVTILLPKYAEAGTKTVRLLSDQKGFSVAMAVVSAERLTPPRDLEPKEVERRRGEIPGYLSRGGVQIGSLSREIWLGIGGGGVDALRGSPAFPDRPNERTRIRSFEIPRDVADDYGSRILGYLHPPMTGDYVFWITSDDQGELWLSTDDDPKNKVLIARMPEWGGPGEFEKFPDQQKSKPVRLEAGRRYYVEALHKEGGGGDHTCVRWQIPGGPLEQPIPGERLSPWTGGKR